jgi:hypothetical protein
VTAATGVVSSSGCPAGCAPITTTTDTYNSSSGGTPQTYKAEKPVTEEPLRAEPDAGTGPAPLRTPHLINPDSQTPARPVRTAVYTREVRRPSAPADLDTGGWRASSD